MGPLEAMRTVPITYFSGLLTVWLGTALLILLLYGHNSGLAVGAGVGFQAGGYLILHNICERSARARRT